MGYFFSSSPPFQRKVTRNHLTISKKFDKKWKYQRLFGFYKLLENQYRVKVNERLNSVFRNSTWQCLERQSATEFGQGLHNSKYLQPTVFAICSQVLGGIVASTGIIDYICCDTELFKALWMFSRNPVCFSSPSLHSKS